MRELAIKIGRNTKGRDLIVGDVHGHFTRLREAMDEASFDPSRDRLFSVGDLVDRGPESASVLDWIGQPWFHAVRGNHESMCVSSDREFHLSHGGLWFLNQTEAIRTECRRQFSALPIAITLETEHGDVGIVHADCLGHDWGAFVDGLNGCMGGMTAEALKDHAQWSTHRAIHGGYPVEGVRAVVVGHYTVSSVQRIANVIYIDTGAWLPDWFASGSKFELIDAHTLRPVGRTAYDH